MYFLIKCLCSILILLICSVTCFDLKDGIFQISSDNLDSLLFDHQSLLLLFTHPSCSECREVDKEFRAAAKYLATSKLQRPQIYSGIINTQASPELAQRFQAHQSVLPKVLLIQKGGQEFELKLSQMGRLQLVKSADYVRLVNKAIFAGVQHVKSEKVLNEILETQKMVVIYRGDTKKSFYKRVFEIVARRFEEAYFIRIDQESNFTHVVQSDNDKKVILIQKGQSVKYYDELTGNDMNAFEKWLIHSSLPSFIQLDQRYFNLIFRYHISALVLFLNQMSDDYLYFQDEFQNIADIVQSNKLSYTEEEHQYQIAFIQSFIGEAYEKQLADMIGRINLDDTPLLAYVEPSSGQIDQHLQFYILGDLEDIGEKLQLDVISKFLDRVSTRESKGRGIKLISKSEMLKYPIQLISQLHHVRGYYSLKRHIRETREKDLVIHFYRSKNSKFNVVEEIEEDLRAMNQVSQSIWNQQEYIQFIAFDLEEYDYQFDTTFEEQQTPFAYFVPSLRSLQQHAQQTLTEDPILQNKERYSKIKQIKVNLNSQREILKFLYDNSVKIREFVQYNDDKIENIIYEL